MIEKINGCEKLLIGIGKEWKMEEGKDVRTAYEHLRQLIGEKDYFVVTTLTDGEIFKTSFDAGRITAPCGNETWQQCSAGCTKNIWEQGEINDSKCPFCKRPLIPNTIQADPYIEEGYLPQWNTYMQWLAGTLNRELLLVELGVGFFAPTVIRWPFEKTAMMNKKAHLYRMNEKFSQIPEEISRKSTSAAINSFEYFKQI